MSNHCCPEPKSPPNWVWVIMIALTILVMLVSPPKFGPRFQTTEVTNSGTAYSMPALSVTAHRGY